MPYDTQENPHCNVAEMLRVVAQIEAEPERFDMSDWNSPCGTVGCIAGHAAGLVAYKNVFSNRNYHVDRVEREAREVLGLKPAVADNLFGLDMREVVCLSRITPGQAVKAIHNVIDRGWPYWKEILVEKNGETD